MNSETRGCQNCKKSFALEQDDFDFHAKLKIPAPTWCSRCLFQRRLAWRNERNLSKRTCEAPGHAERLISMYQPDAPVKVYDPAFYWSDGWDPKSFGQSFDKTRPFFQQFNELLQKVPYPSLNVLNAVNSDYANYGTDLKDCYLTFGGDFNENCMYSTFNFHSKDSAELYFVDHCELCYECMDTNHSYRVRFSAYANNCSDSSFLYSCLNCVNCLGCVNLRNKSYCIFNEQYTKEEYEKRVKEFKLDTHEGLQDFAQRFTAFKKNYPHRYAQIIKSVGSTGDSLTGVKNCIDCFDVTGPAEDCRHIAIAGWGLKDARDTSHAGHNSELIFDSWGVFDGSSRIAYSQFIGGSREIMYSYMCRNSHDLFGCVGLRNAEYCILNVQYTKEEYHKLRTQIIEHMQEMPHIDAAQRKYTFGEFFPMEFSPFPYNHSLAQEYFPRTQEEVVADGLWWATPQERSHHDSQSSFVPPNAIHDVRDEILDEIIPCEHRGTCNELCMGVFRIIPAELALYRRLNLPVPHLCSNCRHYQRFRRRNPLELWHRACACGGEVSLNGLYRNTVSHAHGSGVCSSEFATSFRSDRPEIVYCEQCYQAEVA